jgi:hypothetical protein
MRFVVKIAFQSGREQRKANPGKIYKKEIKLTSKKV